MNFPYYCNTIYFIIIIIIIIIGIIVKMFMSLCMHVAAIIDSFNGFSYNIFN